MDSSSTSPRFFFPLLLAAALGGIGSPSVARADGAALRADLVESKSIKLDGVPKEWGNLVPLPYALRGRVGKPDVEALAGLTYDGSNLYVAADVTDDALRGGGGDHVEVVLGFPGGATYSVLLYPGDPGKSPGVAKSSDGSTIAGAKVVEAPRSGGWSLEAAVPWSAFPPASRVRVGLRGGIFVHDVDSGSAAKNVIGTAAGTSYAALPPLNTESEQSLQDGLLKEKSLRSAPRFSLIADVAGDGMKERVMIFDRYLVVLGSSFRKGSEYYFTDLGADVVACDTRDLKGDGKEAIILRKRLGSGSRYREVMQVLQFGSGEVPLTIFQHEVGVATEAGAVANEVSFVSDGARTAMKITPGAARGFTSATYREPTETSYEPALLPWGAIASQTYKLSGTAFAKAAEERQAVTMGDPERAPQASPAAAAPAAPSASELLEKVYDLYKRDRGVSGRPRFDIAADVAGDGQNERVLLHDRDIVLFGKGFKGGTGYSMLTLQMFASSSDITEMTARDLTGDGKSEIVVKGIVHANGPNNDKVDREVLLVFQVAQGANDSIRRVFAAEVSRAIGRKKVLGTVRFGGGGIELAPGSAVEWTQASYPFGQDAGPIGGLEPLLLPWGGASSVHYRWNGIAFAR